MKFYKVVDGDRAFHDGALFTSEEEVRDNLASYHSIDWTGERDINSLSIEELLEHGQWELEEVEGILCPLCGEPIGHIEHKTAHMWSCNYCPFMGFEFYNDQNVADLIEHTNKYIVKE